jgi:hypothetical protein
VVKVIRFFSNESIEKLKIFTECNYNIIRKDRHTDRKIVGKGEGNDLQQKFELFFNYFVTFVLEKNCKRNFQGFSS